MNAVMQSSAHPLVVLERNRWIIQVLLDRLSAYGGSIFLVTDPHAGPTGAPKSSPHTHCLSHAGRGLAESIHGIFFFNIPGHSRRRGSRRCHRGCPPSFQAWIEQVAVTTLAYGPLHLERSQKMLSAPWR